LAPGSRGRSATLWAATLGIGVLLSIVAGEFTARGLGALPTSRAAQAERLAILQENPHGTGSYRLKPNLDLVTRVGQQSIHISTNRFGMRWRDVDLAKPEGRKRIAFLGDSFTFGSWADRIEGSFVGTFEQRVSSRRFEVLDFGVGGYGLADSELLLDEEVLRFSPDYVILALFNGNDFRDTYLGTHKARVVDGVAVFDDGVVRSRLPSEELVEDGTLAEAPKPMLPLARSALYQMMASRFQIGAPDVEFAPNRNFFMFGYWSRTRPSPTALRARDATLAAIERIHEKLRRRGIGLGVVSIPYKEQVHARATTGRDFDIGLPQAWVQVFAVERGIPYLDLLPPFREEAHTNWRRLYLPDDIHFDNQGHELAGRLIADWFRGCVKHAPVPVDAGPAVSQDVAVGAP
jgi:hypothetical protein